MAQILTRGSLSSLTTLDAGDTVECYLVTRLSKLEPILKSNHGGRSGNVDSSVGGSSNTGSGANIKNDPFIGGTSEGSSPISTSTEPARSEYGSEKIKNDNMNVTEDINDEIDIITVRKSAIAFRYKSRMQSSDSRYSTFKPQFELTLEYGPRRTGADMDRESLPMILSNGLEDDALNKYIVWENEGKIYYEESISPSRWDTADYIAPMTGSVLSNLLELALDYTSHHPRYQPFEVYDISEDKIRVRSSSSDDFVWDMFEKMAVMNVDIRPIINPTRSKTRFFVNGKSSVTRIKIGRGTEGISEVGSVDEIQNNHDTITTVHWKEIVDFYENMYSCSNKVLNANYELFLDDKYVESDDNDNDDTATDSEEIDDDASDTAKNSTMTSDDSPTENSAILNQKSDSPSASSSLFPTLFIKQNNTSVAPLPLPLRYKNTSDIIGTTKEGEGNYNNSTHYDVDENDEKKSNSTNLTRHLVLDIKSTSNKSLPPTNSPSFVNDIDFTSIPSFFDTNQSSTYVETSSAAKATAIAVSQTAQQNLLSGMGSLMTSALLPCITSSLQDENSNTFGYLFIDGTTYFKLNLSYPYWDVITLHPDMPSVAYAPEGKGDFIDWMFVLMIVGGFLFGILKILQKAGLIDADFQVYWSRIRNIVFCSKDDREDIYPFSRDSRDGYGYNPSNRNEKAMVVGGGVPHNFAQDVIPLSMGGRRSTAEASPNIERMKVVNGVTIIGKTLKGKMKGDYYSPGDDEVYKDEEDQGLELQNVMNSRVDKNIDRVPSHKSDFISGHSNNSSPNGSLSTPHIRKSSPNKRSKSPITEPAIDYPSTRMNRDPDLVDLPNLISRTKVAQPVSSSILHNGDIH